MNPVIVLAAHGTRDPRGAVATDALADAVAAALPRVTVRVAYADVRSPNVTDVLREHLGQPVVVVPAFLAAGYHVRVDIPEQIAASGHRDVVQTEHFGPAPELVAVLIQRLRASGYEPGDRVVFAAAGSSDPRALIDVHDAAYALGVRLGAPVRVGYAATAAPTVTDAVADVRTAAREARVAVASWLLAPGLFQQRLDDAAADVTAAPLGVHPQIVDLVVRRYEESVEARAIA